MKYHNKLLLKVITLLKCCLLDRKFSPAQALLWVPVTCLYIIYSVKQPLHTHNFKTRALCEHKDSDRECDLCLYLDTWAPFVEMMYRTVCGSQGEAFHSEQSVKGKF